MAALREHAHTTPLDTELELFMRILITSWPAYGHLYPMLPIARAAQHAGHDVVLATGPDLAPHLEQRGFVAWPVGSSKAEAEAALRATHPDMETMSPEDSMRTAVSGLFLPGAAKRATELVPRAIEWKPDVVIHEVIELAGAVACTGARHAVHGLGLMFPLLRELLAPEFGRLCEQWKVPELAKELYDATYLDICPPSLLPEGNQIWKRIQPLRPAVGEVVPGERLPDTFVALPHADTVYLTLGTVFHQAPGVFEDALDGLRELPFNIVATTGPHSDPARFGPQPPNVVIEPFIPQALLLAQCRVVVSH
ncbi:MAG: glycosyltransferase [Pseudonocardiales bacterium]